MPLLYTNSTPNSIARMLANYLLEQVSRKEKHEESCQRAIDEETLLACSQRVCSEAVFLVLSKSCHLPLHAGETRLGRTTCWAAPVLWQLSELHTCDWGFSGHLVTRSVSFSTDKCAMQPVATFRTADDAVKARCSAQLHYSTGGLAW